jgi:hypothetical protein
MKFNLFGLNRVLYVVMFGTSLLATAATFGTVVLGFEMQQRHVADASWVAVAERA